MSHSSPASAAALYGIPTAAAAAPTASIDYWTVSDQSSDLITTRTVMNTANISADGASPVKGNLISEVDAKSGVSPTSPSRGLRGLHVPAPPSTSKAHVNVSHAQLLGTHLYSHPSSHPRGGHGSSSSRTSTTEAKEGSYY